MEVKHKVQLGILTSLLFEPKLRFAELNKTKLTNDQFTFHLRRSVRLGLVEKAGETYQLTIGGLEYAGRIGKGSNGLVKQPKVSVMVFVFKNTNREILLSKRLTDPIAGMISAPVTKVRAEESTSQAANRCLKEETGLGGKVRFAGVMDYRHFAKDKLVESAVISCFRVSDTVGKLKRTTKKATNGWYPVEDVTKITEAYPGFSETVGLVLAGEVFFRETVYRG